MIFMTEKKARELFAAYMQAELKGENTMAEDLENELKKGGYTITATPDGSMTIVKEGGIPLNIDDFYVPQENGAKTYKGDEPRNLKPLWITLGVIGGLALLTFVVILIIKKRRNVIPARL